MKLDGNFVVKQMTPEEIEEAGITLNNPKNYHVFKYEIKMTFDAEVIKIDKYEVKDDKETVDYTQYVSINGKPAKIVAHEDGEHEEMYMVVTGECKWLKEFYDVQLIVINKDDEGESLTDCKATIKVPTDSTYKKLSKKIKIKIK